jgi:hypothetical protein
MVFGVKYFRRHDSKRCLVVWVHSFRPVLVLPVPPLQTFCFVMVARVVRDSHGSAGSHFGGCHLLGRPLCKHRPGSPHSITFIRPRFEIEGCREDDGWGISLRAFIASVSSVSRAGDELKALIVGIWEGNNGDFRFHCGRKRPEGRSNTAGS